MSVNWADANLPAIVEAWYPGGEGGQAWRACWPATSARPAACR
jgi:hypothetical protein